MKIVMLDRNTLGDDLDISIFEELGEFTCYDAAPPHVSKEYIKDADVIIFNKTIINEELLKDAPNVKLLCITGTGFDNVDIEYINSRNIVLKNVVDYSTASVVQHTFALALFIIEKLSHYDEFVKSEKYCEQSGFSNFGEKFFEISGKTWGIVGMGNIGRGVAKIATAFGANVIYYSSTGKNNSQDYKKVEWEELLENSDIISVHCPLTNATREIFNKEAFEKMKKSAFFINVARGGVVNEEDLYNALCNDEISAAGLDVLSKEPMQMSNPLRKIKDGRKLIVTPHMGWASTEARNRCMQEVYKNIREF